MRFGALVSVTEVGEMNGLHIETDRRRRCCNEDGLYGGPLSGTERLPAEGPARRSPMDVIHTDFHP